MKFRKAYLVVSFITAIELMPILANYAVDSDNPESSCSGETSFGCEEYVSYLRGGSDGWPPVVLSAPHGGYLDPESIPDRDAGCWNSAHDECVFSHSCGVKDFTRCRVTTDGDLYTYNLTTELRNNLCLLFGDKCPAAVLNNLVREKFDANRNKSKAAFDVPEVVSAFLKYKSSIEDARSVIVRHVGYGLLIDIHGHGHRIQRAELGYMIDGEDLDSGEPLSPTGTSIRHLAHRHPTIDFDTLLRGNLSFGGLMGQYGFRAVPSPNDPGPGPRNIYFNGGFLTREYGSHNGGTMDAIQIESARSVRESPTRARYAQALACSIHDFVCMYYVTDEFRCSGERHSLCGGQPSIASQLNLSTLCTGLILACWVQLSWESYKFP